MRLRIHPRTVSQIRGSWSAVSSRDESALRRSPAFFVLLLILGVACRRGRQRRPLDARVVKVTDGDSLEVRDSNGLVHRVRLGGIDAPEYAQPFGNRSRQNLTGLVLNKDVHLEIQKRDAYGRLCRQGWVIAPDAPCSVPSMSEDARCRAGAAERGPGLALQEVRARAGRGRTGCVTRSSRTRHARASPDSGAIRTRVRPWEWRAGLTDGTIKKSRAGICHVPRQPAYRSVK
jgi:hypothetical protein